MRLSQETVFSVLFRNGTNNTAVQLLRYTVVGGCAFAFDFSCLFFLTSYCHLHYLVSAAIAFLVGLAVNYILSVAWVFNRRRMNSWLSEFVVFALIGLGGLLLNEVFIWFFTEVILLFYLVSKAISTVLVCLYNFLVRKFVLFS
jgi:putative flippase GtrA